MSEWGSPCRVCPMDFANLSRCGCHPHALKVLLTGYFLWQWRIRSVQTSMVMLFTCLFSFLHLLEENAGSNVFVCFSVHFMITQVQWFLKNGFSRSHNRCWIPPLAVHVVFTSPVLIVNCLFKYQLFVEMHVKWKAFVMLFKTLSAHTINVLSPATEPGSELFLILLLSPQDLTIPESSTVKRVMTGTVAGFKWPPSVSEVRNFTTYAIWERSLLRQI